MKRLNQNGFSLFFVLAIVVVVLTVGFVAWQVLNKDGTRTDTNASTPVSGASDDCGSNRQCFYEAFSSDCKQKSIKVTQTTIEGDPIVTTAEVTQGIEGCVVEATIDGSQDKFGDGKIHTYTCKKLTQDDQKLTASECTGMTKTSSVII